MNLDSFVNWREAVLSPTATLREAIANLNSTTLQVVLVADDQGSLLGTLTDGDVRRSLLRSDDLDRPVVDSIQKAPIVVGPGTDRQTAVSLLRARKLRHLPVVDDLGRIVGLHTLEELSQGSEIPDLMVVMAGGKGQRLRPYTESCPKPMLPVDGRPILEHILERAIEQGFRRFVFSLHYLPDQIVEYFSDGKQWGVQIDYLQERHSLGTVGGLANLGGLPTSRAVVANGDVLASIDYVDLLQFHQDNGALGTMAVRIHEWQHPYGVVQTDGLEIVGFEEKPQHRSYVNAGVYVLESDALEMLDGKRCDMPELFGRIGKAGGRTIVYPIHESWVDIGQESEYLRVRGETPESDIKEEG
jgi:dTDP-glucose pyrophosphorylase